MLNPNTSRVSTTSTLALASTVGSVKEGTLMSAIMEGGVAVGIASTGAATEDVRGFAMSQVMDVMSAPKVEEATVPSVAPFTIVLVKTPDSAAVGRFAYNPVTTAYDTPVTGSTVSGKTITFLPADAGKKVRIVYSYAPTIVEAQMIFGQGIGDAAQSVVGGTTIVTDAPLLFISNFDATDNWALGGKVYSGANGNVSLKNTGTLLPGVRVAVSPAATSDGFLGLVVKM
jgi:hypothetical protein